MKEGNEMQDMVKVVDTNTGITIAYLDWDAFERSESTMARVAMRVAGVYGCQEIEVHYPDSFCLKLFHKNDNIDILRRILALLDYDYSFEDDVSLEENILLKRLQTKVNTMMEDYVEDFKA